MQVAIRPNQTMGSMHPSVSSSNQYSLSSNESGIYIYIFIIYYSVLSLSSRILIISQHSENLVAQRSDIPFMGYTMQAENALLYNSEFLKLSELIHVLKYSCHLLSNFRFFFFFRLSITI